MTTKGSNHQENIILKFLHLIKEIQNTWQETDRIARRNSQIEKYSERLQHLSIKSS